MATIPYLQKGVVPRGNLNRVLASVLSEERNSMLQS
jgi:hypothetical protein